MTPPGDVVHLDPETLMPVGVSKPCPSTTVAHLAFGGPSGVRVLCGNLAGHAGPHIFHVEWTDHTTTPGLKERLDSAKKPTRRPH
jgi:hypothetical protein